MENNSVKISALLVVYNEEALIERCLKSLSGAVAEIILLHDGVCQDKTLAIAEKFGATVIEAEHRGALEFHFPRLLALAKNDWVLRIDADEFLTPELKDELPRLAADPTVAGYSFLWPLFDGRKIISNTWPRKLALFRKSRAAFLSIPHFIPRLSGTIKKSSLILNHQPAYNNFSRANFRKKYLVWAKLQAAAYLQPFNEVGKFNYQASDWPGTVRWRRSWPLLLLPAEFLITFWKNIFSGAYRAGWLGIRVSLQFASYRVAVNYYLFKLKNNKVLC